VGSKTVFRTTAASAAVLVAVAGVAAVPAHAQTGSIAEAGARTITFTVPMVYSQQALGDVLVEVATSGDVRIETQTFANELEPLLNEVGQEAIATAFEGIDLVTPEDLLALGIVVRFDERRLSLLIDELPADYRPVRRLGRPIMGSGATDIPVIAPADASAYLNVNINQDYNDRTGFDETEVFLSGAARFQDIVLEYDGAFTDQFGEGYQFYRRGVRAVYDQPEKLRRFSAGDLRLATLPVLRTPFIGGVAIEKGRRNFDVFFPAARLGSREIFLDSSSNVEVLINGEVYQNLQLEAGRYDLADLPVQLGNNDIQLVINDSAGRRQFIDYDFFYQPLDLEAGEEEYTLAVGAVAENLTFEPRYSDEWAVVGNYRKAFTRNFIAGGGIQASQDLQVGAVSTSFVPQVIPGGFDFEAAYSTGEAGDGVNLQAGYRFASGNSFTDRQQFSLNLSYESEGYQTLSDIVPLASDILSIGASYSRSLSERTILNAGAIYTEISDRDEVRSTYFVDLNHRYRNNLRLTAGIEYGDSFLDQDDFGVRLGLSYAFSPTRRANADYRSRNETFRATYSQIASDSVGSIGYDLGVTDTRGQRSADASAFYIGNRFDARVIAQTSTGAGSDIFEAQTVRLQAGTSIAWADGAMGIGRPISDSFAVLRPDPAISEMGVVSGRNLSGNEYDARTGALGGAVQGDLISYARQNVEYDVANSEAGIDIGDGVVRVDPPFRSGYAIKVGSAYFTSAAGFLESGGEPVALASGIVRAIGDEAFEPELFFTNSAGRFAIIGLAPGGQYRVELSDGRAFTFGVDETDENLVRLGTVEIDAEEDPT